MFSSALSSASGALSSAGAALSTRVASASAAAERNAAEKEAKKASEAAVVLHNFRAAMMSIQVAHVAAFLESPATADLFPRPGKAEVSTDTVATARRLAPLALKAVETSGYGAVAKLAKIAKYAIKYGSLTGLLLSPSFRVFTDEVVPRLVKHAQSAGLALHATRRGAIEAELALRLWYLGCTEAMNVMLAADSAAPTDAMQDAAETPDEVLASLGEWIGPVQWLGAAFQLPAPHNVRQSFATAPPTHS